MSEHASDDPIQKVYDERAELRVENEQLRAALAPFAAVWARMVEDDDYFLPVKKQEPYRAAWYALARAREALGDRGSNPT